MKHRKVLSISAIIIIISIATCLYHFYAENSPPERTLKELILEGEMTIANEILIVPKDGTLTIVRGAKVTFENSGIVSYAEPLFTGDDPDASTTILGKDDSLFYGLAFPGLTVELRKMVFKNLRLAYRRTNFLRPIGSSKIAYPGLSPLIPPSVPVDVAFMMYAAEIKLVDSRIAGISNPNEEAVECPEDYKWLRRAAVFIADANIEMLDSVIEDVSNLSRQAFGSLTFTAWNSVRNPMALDLERCVFTRVKLTQLQSEGACRISKCIFNECTCEAYVEKNMFDEDYVGCTYIYASGEALIHKSKFLKFSFVALTSFGRGAIINSAFIHTRRQLLSRIDISDSYFEIECMMPVAIVSAEELENKLHPVLEIQNNVFQFNGLWDKKKIRHSTAGYYIFWQTLANATIKNNVMSYNSNIDIAIRGVRISENCISGQDVRIVILFDDSDEDNENLISFFENVISADDLRFVLQHRFGVRKHNDEWRIIIKDCVLLVKKISKTKNFIISSDTGEAVIADVAE